MQIGGQAVIEGVMMRNRDKFAVAVRLPNGKIKVKKEKSSHFPKIFDFFFVRGIVGLLFSLYDGIRALLWSSNQTLEQEEEKLTPFQIVSTLGVSFLFAIFFFIGLPFLTAHLLHSEGIWFNVLDGIFRIVLFLIYLLAISKMKDIQTVFQYHGAEHKVIACYEAKKPLTVANAKKYTTFHPRCGTSFLFVVLILSIILFSFITGAWYVKLLGRLLLIPVIAGLGYEIVKLSSRHANNWLVRMIIAPGLWMQRITTKQPSDKQLEVGIASLKAVLK